MFHGTPPHPIISLKYGTPTSSHQTSHYMVQPQEMTRRYTAHKQEIHRSQPPPHNTRSGKNWNAQNMGTLCPR